MKGDCENWPTNMLNDEGVRIDVESVQCAATHLNGDLHPTRRWKNVQSLIWHVWRRWQKQLLHTYRARTKWQSDGINMKVMKVDDVVLVLEPMSVRKYGWRFGRIVKVFPGSDGVVRVVDVKVDWKIYKRPVTKLCPLEC